MSGPATIQQWFHTRTYWARKKAAIRASAVALVENLETAGETHTVAVIRASRLFDVSTRTIENWCARVNGVARRDHIFHLCNRNGQ